MHISPEASIKLQELDYDQEAAAVIWADMKPSNNYGVQVLYVAHIDNRIEIAVQFNEPQPERESADATTNPYQIMQFKKPAGIPIEKYLVTVGGTELLTFSPSDTETLPTPTTSP